MSDQDFVQRVNLMLSYDHETGVLTWKHKPDALFASSAAAMTWNKRNAGTVAGSKFKAKGKYTGYVKIRINKRTHMAHRLAWTLYYGKEPEGIIDHIDGDGTNNRISNLRDVTFSDNNMNSRMCLRNTSGICGVRWEKSKNRWDATITSKGKRKRIGLFDNIFDAACARRSAEISLGFTARHGV